MTLRTVNLVSFTTLLILCLGSEPQPWETAPGKVRPPPPPPTGRTAADCEVASSVVGPSGKEPPTTPPHISGKKRIMESSPASITLLSSPFSDLLDASGTGVLDQKKSRFEADSIPSVTWLLRLTEECHTYDSLVSLAEYMSSLDKSKYGSESLDIISSGMSEAEARISGSLPPHFESASLDRICEEIIALATTTTAMP